MGNDWHLWGEEKQVQTAGGENFEGRKPLGRLRISVISVLQCILKEMGWIRLAAGRTWAAVGTVMNLLVT